jgi:transcription elongation factor GreB
MRKGFTRKPQRDEPATPGKNYITPSGLERLKDEHRFLLTRERPAVTEVVAWAASNGDRSENADYQYGKRRLRQIDGRIRFLTKRVEAAEVVDPKTICENNMGTLPSVPALPRIIPRPPLQDSSRQVTQKI